jgi:hypothetical protein
MAVEILILSGARQSEQIRLDVREFRVGSDPGCEVRFDPQRDRAIKGRSATFRRQEDGWYIHSTGRDVLVNYETVAGWTRVRSGDVVRMSESGPDFAFSIATEKSPVHCETGGIQGGSESMTTVDANVSLSIPISPPSPEKVKLRNTDRRWVVWTVGVLLVGVLTVLAGRSLFSTPTVIVNVNQPAIPTAAATTTNGIPLNSVDRDSKMVKEKEPVGIDAVENAGQPKQGAKQTGENGETHDLAQQLTGTVYLIQIEKAGHCWPFATCVAVGNDTLLTTAREATQLASWRAEAGLKIWVTRPADGFKEEVHDIRIHGIFASLAEKAGDWIYFDLGLLTIQGKLPQIIPMASPEDSAGLEAGLPVFCFGYTHEGDKITRFDHLEPQLARGKIYVITASRELPGRPRLLHVKAEISRNAYGSPVVNAEGKLIGLYGEVAAPSTGIKNIHYVTIVNPALIEEWLKNRNDTIWLPPAAAKSKNAQEQP